MNAMRRNLDIATKLGCLDEEGLEKMRHGRAPTIRKGRYQGDQLSVDHIIPRAAIPGLDNVVANLELMPLRMNEAKNDKLGPRQRALAYELRRAGLLHKGIPVTNSRHGGLQPTSTITVPIPVSRTDP